MPEELTPIRIDAIRVGQRLIRPLHERSGRKLVGAGVTITPAIRRKLVELDPASIGIPGAGGAEPVPDHAHAARERARRLRMADALVARRAGMWERIDRRIVPTGPTPIVRTDRAADLERLRRFRIDRVRMAGSILGRLAGGAPVALADPASLIDDLIAVHDHDPVACVRLAAFDRRDDGTIAAHALATAALTVSVTMRLGWPAADVAAGGMAGLLADVGMLALPLEVREALPPLSDVELNRVRRHPAYGVVLLEGLDGLPEVVRLVVHQHHEREDGSGYPAALRVARICDHARVIAVTDSFAAATAPRSFRPRPAPIEAARDLVDAASRGVLWRDAVRALLECLHPLLSGDADRAGQPRDGRIGGIQIPDHHVLAA